MTNNDGVTQHLIAPLRIRLQACLPFTLAYITPTLALIGIVYRDRWLAAAPLFALGMLPIADHLVARLPVPQRPPMRKHEGWMFDALLYAWLPFQCVLLALGLRAAAHAQSVAEVVMLALNVGLLAGSMGITVAHELMHRAGKTPRAVAETLMTSVGYAHFCIEHVHGHHVNVSTHEDPASARYGESFYRFLPRTIFGQLRSAWRIESARVAKKHERYSLRDRRVRYLLTTGMLYACVASYAGWRGLGFWFVQSMFAVVLLETINYVEHYGLTRNTTHGRPDPVKPHHSWNSSHPLTSLFLFDLPLHSDHHAHASRAYFQLQDIHSAPQLPSGYAAMLWLAWIPPLFHRAMAKPIANLAAHAERGLADQVQPI